MMGHDSGQTGTHGLRGKATASDRPTGGSPDMRGATKRFKPGSPHMAQHSQYYGGTADITAQHIAKGQGGGGQSHAGIWSNSLPTGGNHYSPQEYPPYPTDFRSGARE